MNVQDINLKCLQSLSEFYDTYKDSIEIMSNKKYDANTHFSFKSVYDFTCYIHPINNGGVTSNNNDVSTESNISDIDQNLIFVPYLLHPSNIISNKSTINCMSHMSERQIESAMNELKNKFIIFANNLGVEVDHLISSNQDINEKNRNSKTTRSPNNNTLQYLDQLAFDRMVIAKHKRSFNSIFPTKRITKEKRDNILMSEIDAFLQSGHNIYVRNMSKQNEFEVVERFREFIFKYADMVLFTSTNWQNLIFIFSGDSEFMYDQSTSYLQIGKNGKYSCEQKNGMFILHVPLKFKAKILVSLISDNIDPELNY